METEITKPTKNDPMEEIIPQNSQELEFVEWIEIFGLRMTVNRLSVEVDQSLGSFIHHRFMHSIYSNYETFNLDQIINGVAELEKHIAGIKFAFGKSGECAGICKCFVGRWDNDSDDLPF